MYDPFLLVHSWLRWIVLLAVIYFFLRSVIAWRRRAPWTEQDNYFLYAFNQIFGFQVLFGLALWIGLSPMTKAAIKNPSLILENNVITFWALQHPITMILAFSAFLVGQARSKKVALEERFKIYALTFALVLILIVSAIPWPWLSYGRAFFRWYL